MAACLPFACSFTAPRPAQAGQTSLTATFAGVSSAVQISVQDTYRAGWPKVDRLS
jgi:hypothetical protein